MAPHVDLNHEQEEVGLVESVSSSSSGSVSEKAKVVLFILVILALYHIACELHHQPGTNMISKTAVSPEILRSEPSRVYFKDGEVGHNRVQVLVQDRHKNEESNPQVEPPAQTSENTAVTEFNIAEDSSIQVSANSISTTPAAAAPISVITPTRVANDTRDPTKARIFDIIPINDDLDMLSIRLHELDAVVDRFVVMESETTFSRKSKPLHYEINKERFREFWPKITHIIMPPITAEERARIINEKLIWSGWEQEVYERNKGFQMALEACQPEEGDWLITSDMDEIPRPSVLRALRAKDAAEATYGTDDVLQEGKDIYRLGCPFYEFSFEYRIDFIDWYGPVIIRYRLPSSTVFTNPGMQTEKELERYREAMRNAWQDGGLRIRSARQFEEIPLLKNACWHCSSCRSNISTIINKLASSSHHEYNKNRFKQPQWIIQHVREGLDLFERDQGPLSYVPDNQDIPEYLKLNRDQFSYMLARKGKPDAGFVDVDTAQEYYIMHRT